MVTTGIIFNYMLLYGGILLLGALCGYMCERVGIVNIGIDGMMCFGAVFFGILSSPKLGLSSSSWGLIIVIFLTMLLTMIVGMLHAFATINLKSNHIISGTAINLIGVAFATFTNAPLAKVLYDGNTKLQSGFNDFLYIGWSVYGSSIIMFVVVLLIALTIWIVMVKTKVGLRYCAIGENPYAVDSQGINVTKYQWIAVLLGSALAGFAGALFLFNIKQFQGNTQGLGFLSLAILIIGSWKVEWITLTSIIFSMFTSLSMSNVLTNIGIPREISYAIPYVLTIFILIFFAKWTSPPENNGNPYKKNE